jgi:hypothetical protein
VRLLRHGLSTELLGFPLLHWIVIGTALGALFGALGSVWRRGRDRTLAIAALAAAFGAEGTYLFIANEPNAKVLAAPLELLVLILAPLFLVHPARDRMKAMGLSLALTPLGAMTLQGVVGLARRVY